MNIITLHLFHQKIAILTLTILLLYSPGTYGNTNHYSDTEISFFKEKNSTAAKLYTHKENDSLDLNLKTKNTTTSEPTNVLNLSMIKIQDATTVGLCCDGKAKALVSGGTPPYSYQWSSSATNQSTTIASRLPKGTHHVTVTDAMGEKRTDCITIHCRNVCAIQISSQITHVACTNEATGSIDITVTGGTPPYDYVWSDGSTNEDLSSVGAGTYTVTITDALSCSSTVSSTIIQPDKLMLSVKKVTNILCDDLGAITVDASGGVAPYNYTIDSDGTIQNHGVFENLVSGSYRITVIDSNDCEVTVCRYIEYNCTYAIPDINTTFIDTPVSGNVLTNDIDFENDTQTVTTTAVTTTQGIAITIDANTGAYQYTPPTGFIGQDTFEYTICDNGRPKACDSATVFIEVLPRQNSENNPPIANTDTAITEIDTPVSGNVLANDFDPDNDLIIVTTTSIQTAEGSTIRVDANQGTFVYTPPTGFVGEDRFEYTICDNGIPSRCDTAVVIITIINNQNNTTVANDDAYFLSECKNYSGNVLNNDFDPEGDQQIVNSTPFDTVDNGVLILNNDGTFTYTPNSQFSGTDSFVYTICDTGDPTACDQATAYFIVSEITLPDITNCDVVNEIIACSGVDNEGIADLWNANNILALESCLSDICGVAFNGTIISDYNFSNLIPSCGLGGIITITYTVEDENGNTAALEAALTLEDTTPPNLNACSINDIILECSVSNAEDIANQWNTDNIELLTACATDLCNSDVPLSVTSDFDFTTIIDGVLLVEYTITDDCGNSNSLTAEIALENITVVANSASLCTASDIESQPLDLFSLLDGEINSDGLWEVVSGDASVIDNQFFDPLSVTLLDEDDSETLVFNYTENDSGCPVNVDVEIEVHNRCAVFACGESDIKISKVMTPNGDPFNEYFVVDGVAACNYIIDVVIVNRWGAIVYESRDYQNDWNGISPSASLGSADQVPTGTYYYIVTLNNSGLKPFRDPLYIGTK